jgi:hypothetical protein
MAAADKHIEIIKAMLIESDEKIMAKENNAPIVIKILNYICNEALDFTKAYERFNKIIIAKCFEFKKSTHMPDVVDMANKTLTCLGVPSWHIHAHKNVCDVISRFFKANLDKINDGIGLIYDGHDFPEVKTSDGRVSYGQDMIKGYFTFRFQFFVPFETEPPMDSIDMRRVKNRIKRLMSYDIDSIDFKYYPQRKQMIIKACTSAMDE